MGVFAPIGAENFLGSPEGVPSGRSSHHGLLLNRKKSAKIWEKWGKMGKNCANFAPNEDY